MWLFECKPSQESGDFFEEKQEVYKDTMVIAGRNALTHILFIGTGKSEGILGIILLKR